MSIREWGEQDLTVRFETGKRVRTFGGWFQNTSVLVNGVRLAGYIQCKRRNGRMEAHTVFSPLSTAVLGMDWKWLYRMHCEHNAVAVSNGFQSLNEVKA